MSDRMERRGHMRKQSSQCTQSRRNWTPIMPVDVTDISRLRTNSAVRISIADAIANRHLSVVIISIIIVIIITCYYYYYRYLIYIYLYKYLAEHETIVSKINIFVSIITYDHTIVNILLKFSRFVVEMI